MKYNKIKMEGVMRKKLMSYVLAAVLTATIAGTAFSVKVGDNFGGGNTSPGGQLSPGGAMNYAPTSESDGMIKGIVGRINAVYNYTDGILVTMMDQNRGITVFDAGRVRATFGYNSNGTYTMTNFFVYGTDMNVINSMPGTSGAEKMKNFLLAVGIAPKQLEGAWQGKTTVAGVEVEVTDPDNRVDASWLGEMYSSLSKGVNFSASINLTAQYGATATISKNGQAQYTMAHSGTVIETYNYSDTGFLRSIETLEIVYDSLTDHEELGKLIKEATSIDLQNEINGKKEGDEGFVKKSDKQREAQDGQSNGMVTMTKSKSVTYMDPFGRASYVMKLDSLGLLTTTQRFSYSTQGSLNSVTDLTTNQKTIYAYGRPSHTINAAGGLVSKNEYAANGMLDGVDKYNDGVIVSRDVFNYGKYLMSVDVTFGALGADGTDSSKIVQGTNSVDKVKDIDTYSWDALRKIYKELTTNTAAFCGINESIANMANPAKSDVEAIQTELDKFDAKLKMYGITNIALYAEHRSNTLLLRAMGLDPAYEKVAMQKKMDDLRAQVEKYKQEAADALSKATGKDIADARAEIDKMVSDFAVAERLYNNQIDLYENDDKNKTEMDKYKEAYQKWLKDGTGPAPEHPSGLKKPTFEIESFGISSPTQAMQDAMSEVRQVIYAKLSKAAKAQMDLNNLLGSRDGAKINPETGKPYTRWEEEIESVKIARQRLEYNNGYSAIASVAISVNNFVEKDQDVANIKRSKGHAAGAGTTGQTDGFEADIITTETAVQTISFNITINDNGGASMGIEGAKRECRSILSQTTKHVGEGPRTIPALPSSDPVLDGEILNTPEALAEHATGANGEPLKDADGNVVEDPVAFWADILANIANGSMKPEDLQALIDANGGSIYIPCAVDSINIMNATGFEDVGGELFLVGITDGNALMTLLGLEAGAKILVMGDVEEDIDGKKVLKMNLDYGGGYAVTPEAIASIKTQLAEAEAAYEAGNLVVKDDDDWIAKNIIANTELFDNAAIDWASGWQALKDRRMTF